MATAAQYKTVKAIVTHAQSAVRVAMYGISECPICFEDFPTTRLAPCEHSVCCRCLHRLLRRSALCPLCRGTIHGCTPAIVVHDERSTVRRCQLTRCDSDEPLGITLTPLDDAVQLKKVDQRGFGAVMGLRSQDVVLAINGLPCYSINTLQSIVRTPTLDIWVQQAADETPNVPRRRLAGAARGLLRIPWLTTTVVSR